MSVEHVGVIAECAECIECVLSVWVGVEIVRVT
jgi:hypothetical protein